MPLISDDAVILQVFAFSETSKILRLLTRTHGIRSVLAKGALRPRSRYGGLLEAFSIGTALFYLKEGRDLQTLSGFDLTRSGQGLGSNLIRFGAASLLAELVLRTASEEPDPSLFDQVCYALARLETTPGPELAVAGLAEAWSLTGHLGFGPTLETCVICDRGLDADEAVVFDYAAGGARCSGCGAAGSGRDLPPQARHALLRLVRGEAVPLERTAAHWMLLSRFLAYHVSEGGAIRSLGFLLDAIEPNECGN